MSVTDHILQFVDQPANKTIVEIGAHEDSETLNLAKHFKHVFSYYEYLKIPEREQGNISVKKMPYPKILEQLQSFDVILLENEFHHFPDIWQMQTYDKLQKKQILFLVEWDLTGNSNEYYQIFQNCRPLCQITREVLDQFVRTKRIKVQKQIKGKYENIINSPKEMIEYFKFMLPDHWQYGKEQFLEKIKTIIYPLKLWEGFDIFVITKND